MSDTHDNPNGDPRGVDAERRRIAAFMAGYSIETTPGAAVKIADFRDHLAPGTRVAVTSLPGGDWRDTLATAVRLNREGMTPVPHVSARSIPDTQQLDEFVGALADQAGACRAIVLAGAIDRPVGPFTSSMDILETSVFQRFGIRQIGVAGHPEGSPDIPDAEIWRALRWKQEYAVRTGAEVEIVTQFAFEAAPLIAWDQGLRDAGIRLPVRIGLPGLATLKTLINHARACGVGPSMRFLTRHARSVSKLMTVNAPDRLTADLARHVDADPESLIAGVHVYPLGGLKKSAGWANAVAAGAFTPHAEDPGFVLDRPVA